MTDRARPGLVNFYDIRPGNGAGLIYSYNPGTRMGLLRIMEWFFVIL